MMQEAEFKVIGLCCVRQQRPIFAEISFELKSGEALIIAGPNGAGKSSLLRLLAGFSKPAKGDIVWKNISIHVLREEYTSHLHYIGHTNGTKPNLSIIENLGLFAAFSHLSISKTEWEIKLAAILKSLRLEHAANIAVKYLSAGQQRRIALAKLFLVDKKIWLIDEPLTALDLRTQTWFLSQLAIHLQNGGIAMISSHHPLALSERDLKTLRL